MQKSKNRLFWQGQTLPFTLLWGGSHALAWLIEFYLVAQFGLYQYVSSQTGQTVLIGLTILLPALIQVQLVERTMRRSMYQWMFYSALGALVSIQAVNLIQYSANTVIPFMMLIFLPTAILQTIWLRQHVRGAWLWILASIVGVLLFALPFRDNAGLSVIIVVAGLLYGLIQGSVMRYLWTQAKENNKAKVDALDEARESDTASLERLQMSNHLRVIAPWTTPDEQAEQHKTR
jgi:hypothetical protein